MTISSKILELWQQHSSNTLPKGYGGKQINGIDLTLLDAEIAGCIHMYVHSDGELDYHRIMALRQSLIDLNAILLLLDSEDLNYFNRLSNLANLVLQEVENN